MQATYRSIVAAMVVSLACAPAVRAQGHSQGKGHAHTGGGGGASTGASSASPLPASGLSTRNFGVWLDDASIVTPGEGWMNVSFGYYNTDTFSEFDMPVTDAGVGLSRRLQFGFSVPVYNVSIPGSPRAHGLGDLYMHMKYQVRSADTAAHRLGIAVLPVVEVLSGVPADGQRRVHFGLPIAFELQRTGYRIYGAGGFFSRGSVFASGAIERAISSRFSATGSLTHSYSTKGEVVPDPTLSRTRTDVSGGVSYALRPSYAVFGAIGRTISRHDPTSTRVSISGGLAVSLAR